MHIKGTVIRGNRRGTALGYPTANIPLESGTESGIYAAWATIAGKRYGAAVFVDEARALLEAYLIDFSGDIYGEGMAVEVVKKIRDARVFSTEDALKKAIADDVRTIRSVLEI